jgi:hypothetical protein
MCSQSEEWDFSFEAPDNDKPCDDCAFLIVVPEMACKYGPSPLPAENTCNKFKPCFKHVQTKKEKLR